MLFQEQPFTKGIQGSNDSDLAKRLTFQTTSQRLGDQVRKITKKGWFSYLKLLEMHKKRIKQNNNTVPDTSSGVKQKQSNEK